MGKPAVTFLGPVYNKVSWIGETIESLQNQTLEDIEIIFIDDGSTDGTPDLIRHYQKDDKRIKLYRLKKNQGLGKAWNYGTPKATSDIICVSSGDDIFAPERAKITYDYFNKKDIDVFYSSFWFCDYKLEKKEYKPAIPYSARKLTTARIDGFCPQYIGHLTMAYTKKIGLKVPYRYYLKVGIDYPFLVDLSKASCKFGWTKKVLAYARILSTGVSLSRRDEVEKSSRI